MYLLRNSLGDYINLIFNSIIGDFIMSNKTNEVSHRTINDVMTATKRYNDLPLFTVKGNHDVNTFQENNGRLDRMLTNKEWYQATTKFSEKYGIVTNSYDPHGGYYYKDFEDKKIRTIWLNRYKNSEENGIPTEPYSTGGYKWDQYEWLAKEALILEEKDN